MNKFSSTLLASLAGGALLLAASPAGASTTKGARQAAPTSPSTLPNGYVVVAGAQVTATNGRQTHGFVTCPGSKKPSGGGAVIASDALAANLNSSYPFGQSWEVDVNNTSGADTTFTVYAVCIAPSSTYTVATYATSQGPMSTQSATVDCPVHTVVTGGGVLSSTFDTGVNINSTTPNNFGHGMTGWTVAMSNSTSNVPNYTVYAICRSKPRGYSIQSSGAVSNAPGTIADTTAFCPGSSVPIGGGGFSTYQSSDTAIDMNSSYPSGHGWVVFENNGGTITRSLYASMVCAGS